MGKAKNGKKGVKKWIFLIIGILSFPLLAFVVGGLFILIISMVVVAGGTDSVDTSLSENGELEIPAEYIPIYQAAAEEYDMDWILLAAIHKIETNFSTIEPMVSSVGAVGHFQFMKATWLGWSAPSCGGLGQCTVSDDVLTDPERIAQFGGYGVDANGDGRADPFDIEDATYTAAKYLSSNMKGEGIKGIKSAIFAYNNADWYVDEVVSTYNSYTNQMVGGGSAEIIGDKAWVVPATKNITSKFGVRWGNDMHKGLDIADSGVRGKPIVAFSDGVITYSQFNTGGYGYLIKIDHGNNLSTYYAHMQTQGLPVGSTVKAGQVIGYVGNTGNVVSSTGDGSHLHFEVRVNGEPVDPLPYLSEFLN